MTVARQVRLSAKRQRWHASQGKKTFGELPIGARFALAGVPDEVWIKRDNKTAVCGPRVMDAMSGDDRVTLRAGHVMSPQGEPLKWLSTSDFAKIKANSRVKSAKVIASKSGHYLEVTLDDRSTAALYDANDVKEFLSDSDISMANTGNTQLTMQGIDDSELLFEAKKVGVKVVEADQRGDFLIATVNGPTAAVNKLAKFFKAKTLALSASTRPVRVRFSFDSDEDRDNFVREVEVAFREKPFRSMTFNASFEARLSNPVDVREVERIAQKYYGLEMSLVKPLSLSSSLQKGDKVRLRVADGLKSRRQKLNGKTATVTNVGRDTIDVELEDGSVDRVSPDQCMKI